MRQTRTTKQIMLRLAIYFHIVFVCNRYAHNSQCSWFARNPCSSWRAMSCLTCVVF